MNNNSAVRNLLVTILVLAVLGGAYYMWSRGKALPTEGTPSTTSSSTSQTLPGGVVINGLPDGATVTEVSDNGIPMPDYTKPITISQSIGADAEAVLKAQFEETKKLLAQNSADFQSWIRLGTLHKIAGDYAGAAVIWEYTAAAYPTNVISFNNLGDLYLYFLKQYTKAEVKYKQAIALSPTTIDYYRSLYYLYRDIYKDKAKQAAILDQGLKANPGNQDLLNLQAEMQKQ